MDSAFRQDLPPPGGYGKIAYKKPPARPYPNGFLFFAAYCGVTAVCWVMVLKNKKRIYKEKIEGLDIKCALEPILLAEKDRAFLLQLRANRDEEAELMKNVPGWEVGTLYGTPRFKTVPRNYYIHPFLEEYYAHTQLKHMHDCKIPYKILT